MKFCVCVNLMKIKVNKNRQCLLALQSVKVQCFSLLIHLESNTSFFCLEISSPENSFTYMCSVSHVQLFETPWTVAHQAPLSMGFSRQEYWNRLSFSPLGYLLNPGIKPASLASPALLGGFFTTSTTWKSL